MLQYYINHFSQYSFMPSLHYPSIGMIMIINFIISSLYWRMLIGRELITWPPLTEWIIVISKASNQSRFQTFQYTGIYMIIMIKPDYDIVSKVMWNTVKPFHFAAFNVYVFVTMMFLLPFKFAILQQNAKSWDQFTKSLHLHNFHKNGDIVMFQKIKQRLTSAIKFCKFICIHEIHKIKGTKKKGFYSTLHKQVE